MEVLQSIQDYINHTKVKNAGAYCMCVGELRALHDLSERDLCSAFCLAFDYGRAKGYRAAKAEVRKCGI